MRNTRKAGRSAVGVATALSRDTEQDDFILRSPVSLTRRKAFVDDFKTQRLNTRTTEMLFERAGAFSLKPLPPPKDANSTGFKVITFKGPFVEGANWPPAPAWDFAVAMERHQLKRFDEALLSATVERRESAVERQARPLLKSLDDASRRLSALGFRSSLFVLTGQLGTQLYVDLAKLIVPDWDGRVEAAFRTTYRIVGLHNGIPILDMPDSNEASVYAVDLRRFATLIRYADEPEFDDRKAITEFTDSEARAILAQQPRLILEPPPESGLEEERIRQLRLRVGLELWETYELTVKDPRAVIARPLVGPPVDY